jgi:DnaK suppressor protein
MAVAHAGPRTDLDLESFRDRLQEDRDRLARQVAELIEQEHGGGPAGETGELSHYDQHMADQATETFQREQDQAVQVSLECELDQMEAALRKMAAGDYGYCDRCGADISAERLDAMPHALFCIRCASDLEARI